MNVAKASPDLLVIFCRIMHSAGPILLLVQIALAVPSLRWTKCFAESCLASTRNVCYDCYMSLTLTDVGASLCYVPGAALLVRISC